MSVIAVSGKCDIRLLHPVFHITYSSHDTPKRLVGREWLNPRRGRDLPAASVAGGHGIFYFCSVGSMSQIFPQGSSPVGEFTNTTNAAHVAFGSSFVAKAMKDRKNQLYTFAPNPSFPIQDEKK